MSAPRTETKELLVFELCGRFFGIPLNLVEEVVPASLITRVPNSPPFLLGLAAVRGKVVGVIDSARRYGFGRTLNGYFMMCYVRGNLTAVTMDRPILAGQLTVRALNEQESVRFKAAQKVDGKFLKEAYELFETLEDGGVRSLGKGFCIVDVDLFVSAEMASRVGEAA